ncbi:MAG: hypothetical protein JWM28_4181 [Chitinophagaceae bacterium]|nr:hypothetical protein [Chitinophagaceae bacterium]
MKKIVIIVLGIITAFHPASAQKKAVCTDECCKKTKTIAFTCKLTSSEFRERKATVVASLKKQILEKKELKNGFAYKFAGTDNIVDEITNFIKTERQCCGFFKFNMSINGDSETWLEITGPKGAKDVIVNELEM